MRFFTFFILPTILIAGPTTESRVMLQDHSQWYRHVIFNTARGHGSDPTGLPSLPKDMAVTPRDYHGWISLQRSVGSPPPTRCTNPNREISGLLQSAILKQILLTYLLEHNHKKYQIWRLRYREYRYFFIFFLMYQILKIWRFEIIQFLNVK